MPSGTMKRTGFMKVLPTLFNIGEKLVEQDEAIPTEDMEVRD